MRKIHYFQSFNYSIFENSNGQIKQEIDNFKSLGFDIRHKKVQCDVNPDNQYDVYWGRNRESNHHLTSNYVGQRAKSLAGVGSSNKDIWLHASGYPGSHVLVKALKDDRIPDNVINKAAEIAKKNSKAKDVSNAPIVWAFRDDVSLYPSEKVTNIIQDLDKKVDKSEEEIRFIEKNQPGIGKAFIEDINRNIIYI